MYKIGLVLLLFGILSTCVLLHRTLVSAEGRNAVVIKDFVGVNAVVNDDPFEIAKTAGWVRDYHKWYWYEPNDDDFLWDQPWQYLDTFYAALNAEGVKVMPVVEMAPSWATTNERTDGTPNSLKHAEYLGALASHYNRNIAAIEDFNEPDRCCSDGKLTSYAFGEMAGLDFQMVDAANPSILKVLAGLSNANTVYLDKAYERGGYRCDVLNFHWYAVGDKTNGGVNPESGRLSEQIDEMKAWRDVNAPGKPIWITEFGWDTFAQADGRRSEIQASEQSAANYLLRALFLMQGYGIEKAFVYLYRDTTDNQAYLHYLYHSAGLVTNKWEMDDRKKTGWYYLATLKNVLGDYTLDGIVSNGPNVYHYEYVIPGTNRRAAVLWARDGERDYGHTTAYVGPAGTLVIPVDGSIDGISVPTDGDLVLSETPVFVLYSGESVQYHPATPTSTPLPQADAGLLVNGGFENGLEGWYSPPWFSDVMMLSWSHVHSGNRALRINGNIQGPYIRQEVAVAAGKRLELSGWAQVTQQDSDKPIEVVLIPLNIWGGEILPTPIVVASYMDVTDGWVPFSGATLLPERTSKVRIQIQCSNLKGTAYFDSLALTDYVSFSTPIVTSGAGLPTETATYVSTETPTSTSTSTATPITVATYTPTTVVVPTATETTLPTATPTAKPQPSNTPAPSPGPVDNEIVANGGFESGLDGWYLPPWFSKLVGVTDEVAFRGMASLGVKGKGTGLYIYQEANVTPGRRVDFSGWVNVVERKGGMSMVVEMVARDASNRERLFPIVTMASATSGWVPISGSATMPGNIAKLRLQVRFPILDGAAYLDELSLRAIDDTPGTATAVPISTYIPVPTATATFTTIGTNPPTRTPTSMPILTATMAAQQARLANPGFEDGLLGWNLPSWLSQLVGVETVGCHSGYRCLRFQGRGNGVYLFQEVDVLPNEKMWLSGWVYLAQRQGSTSIVLELVARDNANREKVFQIATLSDATSGWVLMSGYAVMPANVAKLRVMIRFPYLDGKVYLDDLSLVVSG